MHKVVLFVLLYCYIVIAVYISQLIRYARACTEYAYFIDRSKSCSIRAIRVTGSKLHLNNFVLDILTFLAYLVNLSHSLQMICYACFNQS